MPVGIDVLLIYSAIFFFAALIHGSVGIGFPIIATPLLALMTDIQTAILLTLIPTLLVNVVSILSEGSFIRAIRQWYSLVFISAAGSLIGTLILINNQSEFFKLLLAATILTYLYANNRKISISWFHRYPRLAKLGFGLAAGLVGGMTNVMGPVLVIYLLEERRSRSEIFQAANLCFLSGKLIQLVTFSLHQKMSSHELMISIPVLLIVSLALYIAVRLKKRISQEQHFRLLKGFLFLLAMLLCGQALI